MRTIQTTTQEVTLGPDSGLTIVNSATSTGTLTIQVRLVTEWVTIGTVSPGTVQYVDARNITIRCLVSGSVNYGFV